MSNNSQVATAPPKVATGTRSRPWNTPLNANTFYGHLLFGLGFTSVRTTIARGRVILDEGQLPHLNEEAIRARCMERATRIWSRVE